MNPLINPQRYLTPAVYDALTSGGPLPGAATVAEFQPTGANYVLLSQPTAARLPGGAGACWRWSCTLLLDCVAGQQQPGAVSAALCDELADAVLARLDGQRLPLAGRLQMDPARLELLSGAEDFDQELIDVHRYVRMRFDLYLTF